MAKRYIPIDDPQECLDMVGTGVLRWGSGKHPYRTHLSYSTGASRIMAKPGDLTYDSWLFQIRSYGVFVAVDDEE